VIAAALGALIYISSICVCISGDHSERAIYLSDREETIPVFVVSENQNDRSPVNSVRVILIKDADIQKNADLPELSSLN
jgi:hypothetical protein